MPSVRRLILIPLASIVVIGAACAPAPSGVATQDAATGPTKGAVTLSDFKIAPAVMQVSAGQPVEFDVSNQGPSAHTFTIVVGGEQKGTSLIQAGSNATLNIPALAAGTYQALCRVSGHAQLGMKATVEATNGASASPSSAMGSMDPWAPLPRARR